MNKCLGCEQPTDSTEKLFGEPVCASCLKKWDSLMAALAVDKLEQLSGEERSSK